MQMNIAEEIINSGNKLLTNILNHLTSPLSFFCLKISYIFKKPFSKLCCDELKAFRWLFTGVSDKKRNN
jgi:hypothetical protein